MRRSVRVRLAELDARGRAVVEVEGRRIAVFAEGAEAWAVDNACPHRGNPLVEGALADGVLTCAFHLWRFDLRTGSCLAGEAPARCYEASVEDGAVVVQLGTE